MNAGVILTCVVVVVMPLMTRGLIGGHTYSGQVWEDWKALHGKSYTPREEMYRSFVFYTNLQKIQEHNAKYPVTVSYYVTLNQFSDMTPQEIRSMMSRTIPLTHHKKSVCRGRYNNDTSPAPDTLDLRTKGYVTDVKKQNHEFCFVNWAFATTGALEGQYFKKTGKLMSLSAQQLIDCSRGQGNQGCVGGTVHNSYSYVMSQPGGLMTEKDYPFIYPGPAPVPVRACEVNASQEVVSMKGCVDIETGNEWEMKRAVAHVGPITVAIDGSHDMFVWYGGGVYYEPGCSKTDLNMELLIVGYGTYQSQDYWLVKNSWGKAYGNDGYIMMARNRGNNCGIATMPSFPVV